MSGTLVEEVVEECVEEDVEGFVEGFVEECVGSPDAVLDERLRANELELRRLHAERAAWSV